jgi:hypothetical protein
MRIFQHPGETDCCYVEDGGKLYEVDMAGWSLVVAQNGDCDGACSPEYNNAVLEGSYVTDLDSLVAQLGHNVVSWSIEHNGGLK